jgi:hypothetical protein
MKKINFKEIDVYTDISKTKSVKGDARKEFANLLYTSCDGIDAHSLAFKIYESDGEIEITEQQEAIILRLAEQRCTPAFIDGIRKQLKTE